MQPEGQKDADQLKELLEHTLKPRGHDPVTAQSDLWLNAGFSEKMRTLALKLQGSDLYKKVKPPGDTTLYKDSAWTLESVVDSLAASNARPAAQPAPQFSAAQLAAAFTLPPGHHVLPEAAKGTRVQPPR